MERAHCGSCGKQFANKKGVKQHILRMHVTKPKKTETSKPDSDKFVTLEEETTPATLTQVSKGYITENNEPTIIIIPDSPKKMLSPMPQNKVIETETDLDGEALSNNL